MWALAFPLTPPYPLTCSQFLLYPAKVWTRMSRRALSLFSCQWPHAQTFLGRCRYLTTQCVLHTAEDPMTLAEQALTDNKQAALMGLPDLPFMQDSLQRTPGLQLAKMPDPTDRSADSSRITITLSRRFGTSHCADRPKKSHGDADKCPVCAGLFLPLL